MSAEWPETCDQKTFAALRGVSEPMVTRWKKRELLVMTEDGRAVRVRESMARLDELLSPIHGGDRTGGAKPERKASAAALLGGRDSYVAEAALEKRVSRQIKELELAKARGQAVDAEAAAMQYARLAAAARAELMALPRRLASAFDPDPAVCERRLRAGIVEACGLLADPAFGDGVAVVRVTELDALRAAVAALEDVSAPEAQAALLGAARALLEASAQPEAAP